MESESDVHPENLQEKPPELLLSIFYGGVNLIASCGWYLLGLAIAGTYAWQKWLQPRYEAWQAEREESEYAAKYHKNPDIEQDRLAKVEAARRRMQEENDRKAAEFAERQMERDEAKRREKEAERERLGYEAGHRLGDANSQAANNQRASFRPEYNPLMGGGGSSGYRPPRRGGCPGGGCG